MEKVNIFESVDYESSKDFVKFTNIGDKVQGTFISRDDNSTDSYHNAQTLVGLLQEDGTVKTVSVRHNKVGLLEELDKCNLGQIIGFIFTGTKDNPGKQPTKFIRLVHDAKYVDEKWLAARKDADNPTLGMTAEDLFPGTPKAPVAAAEAPISIDATLVESTMSDADKIKEIASLAKSKLGATNVEEVKIKIVEKTGLEFINSNLDLILAKLKTL